MSNPPSTTTTFIQQLRANDAQGWERFRRHYIPLIYTLAKKYTVCEADAMTITDTVVEKIAAEVPAFKRMPGKKFRSFVKTICFRQISDLHRQRKRDAQKLDPRLFDKRFAELELRRAVTIAKQRGRILDTSWDLFDMRFEQKLSISEIAAAKGLKPASVQKTIRRAVLAVQKVLSADG